MDVVFNGTDTRKPLGLAEVTITFADCEKELGTDYHEVTIQRRVYRDGSGEYFLDGWGRTPRKGRFAGLSRRFGLRRAPKARLGRPLKS